MHERKAWGELTTDFIEHGHRLNHSLPLTCNVADLGSDEQDQLCATINLDEPMFA
jgi:hypothetical protein